METLWPGLHTASAHLPTSHAPSPSSRCCPGPRLQGRQPAERLAPWEKSRGPMEQESCGHLAKRGSPGEGDPLLLGVLFEQNQQCRVFRGRLEKFKYGMNIRWYSRIIVQHVRCDNGICGSVGKCPYFLDVLNEIFGSRNALMSVIETVSAKHRANVATCNTCSIQMIGLKAFIKLFSFHVFAIFPIMVFEKTICVMSIEGARGVFCSGHAFWDSAPHQCVFLLKAAKPVRRRTPHLPWAGGLSPSPPLGEAAWRASGAAGE